MAIIISIPTPKDVVTNVKNRAKRTAFVAENLVLSGVKRVAYAVSDKAIDITEKIDDHANEKISK